MAFVIRQDNEDRVVFYSKKINQPVNIVSEYVERGDSCRLTYLIKKNMFLQCEHLSNPVFLGSRTLDEDYTFSVFARNCL